jgi:hypothetical protein
VQNGNETIALWTKLVPEEVQKKLWENRDKIEAIQVIRAQLMRSWRNKSRAGRTPRRGP